MNLSLDLELNDKPDTEIQHQEPLTIEISHSTVQTTSGKYNYCSLFILLWLSSLTEIPNEQKIEYLLFLQYTIGMFSIHHKWVNQIL